MKSRTLLLTILVVEGGKLKKHGEKPSQKGIKNSYDARYGNRTRATLVRNERMERVLVDLLWEIFPGGDSNIKKVEMLVENFEIDP